MSETAVMVRHTPKEWIELFREAFAAGVEGIQRAGEIYVQAVADDKRNEDRFREEFADAIPPSIWAKLYAVGHKLLHPRLLVGGMKDTRRAAFVSRLPYGLQERVLAHERFPLLLAGGDTLQVDVTEASPEQLEQMFDGGAVRSPGAQRVWMEARKAKGEKGETPQSMPYTIHKHIVTFRRGVSMSKAEVRALLASM
jgi:hypothetical protein